MAKHKLSEQSNGEKGTKRMRRGHDTAAGDTATVGVRARHKGSAADVQSPTEVLSGFQRMDEATTAYLVEVKSHFDTLDDGEEMALLVDAFLFTCSCDPALRSLRSKSSHLEYGARL